jgi:hypothetical protein
MEIKNSKLLSGVIFTFSLLLCMLIALPILVELDSILTTLMLLVVTVFGIISLSATVEKKILEYILSEIERHKNKHVEEFFRYMDKDSQFVRNVLRKDIPIINDDNEEIGTQTIYSAFRDKYYKFIK